MTQTDSSKGRVRRNLIIIIVAVLLFIVIIGIVGWLTLSLSATTISDNAALYPYTVTYDVLMPEGEQISIGGTDLVILTAGDDALMKIGDTREKIILDEVRTISKRKAVIKTLGIPLLETNYQVDVRYLGIKDGKAHFLMKVMTSRQVPEFLLAKVLPPSIMAVPV